MNIIFGGNGFVGKNLNLNGKRPTRQECDLLNYHSTLSYCRQFVGKKNLKIINLAAKVAGAPYNKDHNLEMLYENSLMVLNLAKVIKDLKLNCYFLYISSVCAYDNDLKIKEENFFDGNPYKNNFGYGHSKKIGVIALESLKKDILNFQYGVLVPTNLYGPYDQTDLKMAHVIPSVFLKMKEKKEINILGNANTIRNFLYVEDLCRIIKVFVDKQIEGLYNIASPQEISIFDLVEKIKKITNFKYKINYSYTDFTDNRFLNIEKLREKIENFKFTNLDEGLQKTFNWIK